MSERQPVGLRGRIGPLQIINGQHDRARGAPSVQKPLDRLGDEKLGIGRGKAAACWPPVRDTAERSLANAILVSCDYRQHDLPEGMLLSERRIAGTEVHVLLDGLLLIEIDHQPVLEAGPGAVFDPAMRTPYSQEHVTVRAATPCRLAVVLRGQLDSEALLGVADEQTSRLRALEDPAAGTARSGRTS